ncbi:MAG: hypothetical protein KKG12_01730 [Gammaproteobacteria bacterium]|nr:hypothetical protein [Gammaproteobacteria bacterium]
MAHAIPWLNGGTRLLGNVLRRQHGSPQRRMDAAHHAAHHAAQRQVSAMRWPCSACAISPLG